MTKYFKILLCLSLPVAAIAQEQQSYKQLADKHFYRLEYAKAIGIYEKLAAKPNANKDVNYKLAYSYQETNEYAKALDQYSVYHTKDTADKEVLYTIGNLMKILQRYEDAKRYYAEYLSAFPDKRDIVTTQMRGCDSAILWTKNQANFAIYNESGLNTNLSDWGASVYNKQLVYTSEDMKNEVLQTKKERRKKKYGWTGNPYLRLYAADTKGYAIGDTMHMDRAISDFGVFANSSKYHVGPATFSPDNSMVFFTVTNKNDKQQRLKVRKGRVGKQRNLQLFYSTKDTSGQWKEPIAFQYNKPEDYSVGHAAFSKDGNRIYFISDMPGCVGKTDIWYCDKGVGDTWKTPQNMGVPVNTTEDEAFPTIGKNGDLYFSSNGHAGMGGFDIYKLSQGKTSVVANMKPPFNSSYDDFYLTSLDNKTGYFSSNRPGGKGSDDIYAFKQIPSRTMVLKAILVNKQDSKPLQDGTLDLTAAINKTNSRKNTDAKGTNYFVIDKGIDFILKGEYKDYIGEAVSFKSLMQNEDGSDTLVKYVYLEPKAKPIEYKVGDKFVLEDLYYDYNKFNIRPDAALVLDKLVDVLNKYPTMEIELSSHTDSRGSDKYNMTLSQNRATSAVQYLYSKAIAKYRVKAQGYGETRLLNKCKNNVPCSEEDHQKNRRTEVKVLKM